MTASKYVSLDEYLDSKTRGGVARKCFAHANGVIVKAMPSVLQKAGFDANAGTMTFVMSAEVEDRDRDIVKQKGLDTSEFEKNPVAPWAHKASDPPIGQWSDIKKVLSGPTPRTEGLLTLTLSDPMAQRVAGHMAAGSLRACSIGFMPTAIERRDVPEDRKDDDYYYYPGYLIHEATLYECSPCTIPANPAALAKAAADGDVMSAQVIQEVLDTWTIEKGLIMPRKAFEAAHRHATGDKTISAPNGKSYSIAFDAEGKPVVEERTPTVAEEVERALGSKSFLTSLGELFGLTPKGKTEQADPAPGTDGVKTPPEPTPETKARDAMREALPALEQRHRIIELSAREAALDIEMEPAGS